MNNEELKEVLRLHALWLKGEEGGVRANLKGADLKGVDMREANLKWANLVGADMRGANLEDSNLTWARMEDVNLTGAYLARATMRDVYLARADMRGAKLAGADLMRAVMKGADMRGAYLKGANLVCANLEEANLVCADLGFNAYFAEARGVPVYQASCGFGSRNATLTLFAQGERSEWLFFTGCFKGGEEELRKAVVRKHSTYEQEKYFAAIDYLLTIATLNTKQQ